MKEPSLETNNDPHTSFLDTAARLPRKEPHKALGALVGRCESTSSPEPASPHKTAARQSWGGTGAQNGGCPRPGTPATLHSVLTNTFQWFPGFEHWAFAQRLPQKAEQVVWVRPQVPWFSLALSDLSTSQEGVKAALAQAMPPQSEEGKNIGLFF